MGDQKLLSRASPCFGRHVKPLVPAASAVVSTHQSALGPRGGSWPNLPIQSIGKACASAWRHADYDNYTYLSLSTNIAQCYLTDHLNTSHKGKQLPCVLFCFGLYKQ
ncbi:unnamed protein product [Chilo suppressalis]|uniref:Uncharacterized protein n=1 Tax=Chilo suppressalis TaxID=168631 RepID=A0ABN8AT67_CHISP|nr:unnamed protein product [Chilo suppressalis]